jgi:hypothetical protein
MPQDVNPLVFGTTFTAVGFLLLLLSVFGNRKKAKK